MTQQQTPDPAQSAGALRAADSDAGVISDEQLDLWAAGPHRGEANSVRALRPLSPELRYLAAQEARALESTTPGYTMSSAMWAAARSVQEGRTPGLDAADALMAYDPDGIKAAAHAGAGGSWDAFREAAAAR